MNRVKVFHKCLGIAVFGVLSIIYLKACEQDVKGGAMGGAVDYLVYQAARNRRLEEVRCYLKENYFSRFNIVTTTPGPFGETVDWVDPRQLDPDYYKRRPPKDEPSLPVGGFKISSSVHVYPGKLKSKEANETLLKLWNDPATCGPEKTVAMIRPNYNYYISGRSGRKSLQEFITLGLRPQPKDHCRLYAGKTDTTANIGTTGWIRYYNPAQVPADGMSLAQLALLCWGNNGINTLESIEIGIQENPSLYGDSNLHLFGFFRTSGREKGDYIGGYNTNQAGFVPRRGALPLGATIPSPEPDGYGYEYNFRAVLADGAWWVGYKTEGGRRRWLGYYPVGRVKEKKIPFGRMRQGACEVRWYGEVYDPTPTKWTLADMGNGTYGRKVGTKAALFREMIVEQSGGRTRWFSSDQGQGGTDPACYDASDLFYNPHIPGWYVWFRYGGPGGDAEECR